MGVKRRLFATPKSTKRSRLTKASARRILGRFAKRIRRKRRASKGKMVMYNRLLQHKVSTKLVYCDTVNVSPGASRSAWVFVLNSIYDVDYTGQGHQPAYHDKWKALYANYRVTAARWSLAFTPNRSANNNLYIGGADTYPYTDTSHADQTRLPGILFYETADTPNAMQTSAADRRVIRETRTRSCKIRMTGPKPRSYFLRGATSMRAALDDPDKAHLSTTFGSNPANPYYLQTGAMTKDGSTMADYKIDVRIEFFVEFTDPLDNENEN